MNPPNRRRILANWAILMISVLALGAALYVYYRAVTAPTANKKGRGKGFRFTVKTAAVTRTTLTPSIVLQGDVVSNESATIRAEVSGVVTKVLVANGQQVKTGDVLVQLDDKDVVLAVRRTQALTMEAHANQVRSDAAVAKAKDLVTRLTKLDKYKLVSAEDLEQARIALRTAEAGAAQARAQAALRYVELLSAKRELSHAQIRARSAGRIAKRLVAAGDRLAVGTPVVELVGNTGLELHLYVPVSSADRVRPGTIVRFRRAGRDGAWHRSTIHRVLPVADPQSRNQTAVVTLAKPPSGLTAGQAVEARLSVGRIADTLVVSSDALSRFGKQWVVFKVSAGKAQRVPVKILGEDVKQVAVRADLRAGDQVVTVGNEALFPGAPVRVVPTQKLAGQAASGRPASARR